MKIAKHFWMPYGWTKIKNHRSFGTTEQVIQWADHWREETGRPTAILYVPTGKVCNPWAVITKTI
jgi:hypothetical protein